MIKNFQLHKFHEHTFREYDIRGIFLKDLFPEDAYFIGKAFSSIIKKRNGMSIAIGHDVRQSSPILCAKLISGLIESGITVHEIGLCPTPALYYSVYSKNLDAGIMITGSHNSSEYNGFKFLIGKKPFYGEEIKELIKITNDADFASGDGKVIKENIYDDYIKRVLQNININKKIKIAFDANNGAASLVLQKIAQLISDDFILINSDINKPFPNNAPDPSNEANLKQLQQAVIKNKCDIGIAFDGDADRIGVIDNEGHVIKNDILLCLYAKEILKKHKNRTVIADVKSSAVLFNEIKQLNGHLLMAKTGHSIIKRAITEHNAILAGEMSGHIFFADDWYGFDDALYAAVRLIALLSNSNKTLAELKKELPVTFNTPEIRFYCSEERKFKVIEEIKNRINKENALFIDGIRFSLNDGWWLIRASNTQDMLVARIEAFSKNTFIKLQQQLCEELIQSGIEPPKELIIAHAEFN